MVVEIFESKNLGFCSGVNYAYKLVLKLLEKESNVYLLNELVHNRYVNLKLQKKGLKIVQNIDQIPNDEILVAPAHGLTYEDEISAKKRGIKIINATCPFVIRSLKLGKKVLNDGFFLFIIGEKNHQEIKFLYSNLKSDRTFLIDNGSEIPKIDQKIYAIVQTTYNVFFFEEIKKMIKSINKNVIFYNTLCKESLLRQKEVLEIAKKVDLLLVVGGKNSANTKRLYEIGKNYTKSFHIESESEINLEWFKDIKSVGIVSGTSTPMEVIDKVKEKCLKLQL